MELLSKLRKVNLRWTCLDTRGENCYGCMETKWKMKKEEIDHHRVYLATNLEKKGDVIPVQLIFVVTSRRTV